MKRTLVAAAAVAALAAASSAAYAVPVTFAFDPTGGGSTALSGAGIIDQAPGNALAENGITAISNYLSGSGSTGFTLYYQGNLSTIQDPSTNPLFTNGNGGHYFTFTAGFGETVTSAASNNTATFAFNAGNPVNYFTMYATNALGNNLTGAGFATGHAILSGMITSIPSSGFTISSTNAGNIDQSPNGNQWGTQQTVGGSGASDITMRVTSVDSGYFPTLNPSQNITMSFFNTSQIDPYNQADPSKCMNTTTTCDSGGGINTVGTLGAINGVNGPNFLFQADANQSISVPTPGTVALLGLGLLMIGARGMQRRRSSL